MQEFSNGSYVFVKFLGCYCYGIIDSYEPDIDKYWVKVVNFPSRLVRYSAADLREAKRVMGEA